MEEKIIFKPAPESILTEEQAQVFGERLVELQEENGGYFDIEMVVNDAKNPNSPLHKFITSNNGEYQKLQQQLEAKNMIDNIYMIMNFGKKEKIVRGFQYLTFNKTDNEIINGYITTDRALRDPELSQQMIEKALQEIYGWFR